MVKYKCPVCNIIINQVRYKSTIHDHFQNEIARYFEKMGYKVELEYPLNIDKDYSEMWTSIKISYEEKWEERVKRAWKWRHVDIYAKKGNKIYLIEIEGTADNNRVLAVKVHKMMKAMPESNIIVFSAETYINRFAKKNIEGIRSILPSAEDYSVLNPYIYDVMFKEHGLECEYWNEDKLIEIIGRKLI